MRITHDPIGFKQSRGDPGPLDSVAKTLPQSVGDYLCCTSARARLTKFRYLTGIFRQLDRTPPILADLAGSYAERLIVSYSSYASDD